MGHPKSMGGECQLITAEALIDLYGDQYSSSDPYIPTTSCGSVISISELVDQMSQLNPTVMQLAKGQLYLQEQLTKEQDQTRSPQNSTANIRPPMSKEEATCSV